MFKTVEINIEQSVVDLLVEISGNVKGYDAWEEVYLTDEEKIELAERGEREYEGSA